jgi:hypothetical protein
MTGLGARRWVAGIPHWNPAIIADMDAAARRATMQVRLFASLHEHDREDPQFWKSLPVDVRVSQVWTLSEAQWRLRGEYPDERGLPRSVARLHRP